jgi:hypothetical protein
VPELNRRYADLHERTISGVAAVYSQLYERVGTTPRYPMRVLAQIVLGLNVGTFLEQLVDPSAADLPVPNLVSELILQSAPPAVGER